MEDWLQRTVAYIPAWIDYQLRRSDQVGCLLAIVDQGELVLEYAGGSANLATAEPLTPRHRFRIASHSKSFTAAGLMLLRERGQVKLDDKVGAFIAGLHDDVAQATIAQLMSHTAGLTRDGNAGNQFAGLRPFADKAEILADLAKPPVLDRNTRFKYSNHGFALLGLVIEAVVGEPYTSWIRREVIARFGLTETEPDMPLAPGTPFARGHTGKVLLGRRQVISGDYTGNALTPAGGFVSTAADLAWFYAQLSPQAANSPLTPDSRREMTRGQWKCPHATFATNYGLGIISGKIGDWDWFGHSGGLLGYNSRSVVVPERDLAIAVLTNADDGLAWPWLDGILHVARALAKKGEPTEEVRHWTGRWWGAGGAIDLLPAGDRLLVAVPAYLNPVLDASEIEVSSPNEGRVAVASGYAGHGEPVRFVRDGSDTPIEFWAQGTRFAPEAVVAHEMQDMYGAPSTLSRIGQIALAVRDVDRAEAFYRDVLQLRWLYRFGDMTFFDCSGLRLLLEKAREPGEPTHASPIYFSCADITLAVRELEQRGVTFTSKPQLIAPMEDHNLWMAFFCDPDGHTLALMHEAPKSYAPE